MPNIKKKCVFSTERGSNQSSSLISHICICFVVITTHVFSNFSWMSSFFITGLWHSFGDPSQWHWTLHCAQGSKRKAAAFCLWADLPCTLQWHLHYMGGGGWLLDIAWENMAYVGYCRLHLDIISNQSCRLICILSSLYQEMFPGFGTAKFILHLIILPTSSNSYLLTPTY